MNSERSSSPPPRGETLARSALWLVWLVVMGLVDAAVIYHSTTHNQVTTTLAIAAGMLVADVVATCCLLFLGVVFYPENW